MQRQPVRERPDQHQPLLAARHVLRERHHPGVAHRLGEQLVGLLAALVGSEVVRVLEVDGIDVGERHELLDVERLARGGLERLQLLVGEEHVLVLRDLVTLHQLAALDDALAARAPDLLLDARPADLVKHVEGRLLGVRRDVEAYRNGHQPEADRPRADRACRHGFSKSPAGRGLSNLDRDAPAATVGDHAADVVAGRLRRPRDVACATRVVDEQIDLVAAR